VPDGSIDDLAKAAGLATLLWGGIYCPIVPVSADAKFAQQLIDLFNVDVLFPLAESPEINQIVEANRFLSFMQPYEIGLLSQQWQSEKKGLVCLDILHPILLYWAKQIKEVPEGESSHARLVQWHESDPLAVMFSLQFGYFPSAYDLKIDFKRAFVEGLRGKEQAITMTDAVDEGLNENVTPIAFTSHYVESTRSRWDSGVYIGNASSFLDLLSFWNLRAAGAALTFYPVGQRDRLEAYTKRFAASLKPTPPNPYLLPAKFAVHYAATHEEEARCFITELNTAREKVLARVEPVIWNGLNVKPSSIRFDRQQVLANIDRKFDRPSLTLALPPRRFIVDDGEQHPHINEQHLAVSLDPLTEFDYPDRTLRPPLIRRLNEFYSREAAFDPWALRVQKEGVALVIDAADSSVSLYPIERKRIVEKIFALAGITATSSLPGRMASRIIEKLGGWHSIEPGRVFKVRGVRKLLKETAPMDKITLETALSTIGSERFADFKNLHLARQAGSELTPTDVFNVLISKGIFAPKIRPSFAKRTKKVSCNACGLSSQVKLRAFEGSWTCPYCDYQHSLPTLLRNTFGQHDMKMWTFRKTGLFAKDNNQEGFVPVILALMWFESAFRNADACFTTALDLKSAEPDAEIDFCVLQYKYGEHIELGLGEAKASAGRFTQAKVNAMKAVCKKFEAIGIACFPIFAKTSDAFRESEISLFKELKGEWIQVIALSNRELESYEPYSGDDDLPVRHAFTLAGMARNTDFRYLS
jgi:hypothetical protein